MDWVMQELNDIDFKAYRKKLNALLIMYARDGLNTLGLAGRIYRSLITCGYPKELLHFFIKDCYRKNAKGDKEIVLDKYGYEDFIRYREWIKSATPNTVTIRSRMRLRDEQGEVILEIGDKVYELAPKVLLKAIRIHNCMLSKMLQGTLEEEFLVDIFEYSPIKLGGVV